MSDKYIRVMRKMALDGLLDAKTAHALLDARDKEFVENEHPRGKGGKFVKKGSGTASKGGESTSGTKEMKLKETPSRQEPMRNGNKPIDYRETFKRQTGENMATSPQKMMSSRERSERLENLRTSNTDMAARCREEARKWPEGSDERKIYQTQAEILSKPLTGRPTPEESKAMTKKFLANISSKLKPYAVERYKRDLANEPQITNDICDIADELGTGMFGLGYRLKKASDSADGVCRIDEKIRGDIEEARKNGKELTYEQAVDNLGDLVRYTQACTVENLTDNAQKTIDALEKRGYKCVKCKNTWESFDEGNPYRGVNCSFISPTGTKFELQFHTAESLVCNEVQHGWYEEARTEATPQKRKDELNARMYNNAKNMQKPIGIGRLKSFKR